MSRATAEISEAWSVARTAQKVYICVLRYHRMEWRWSCCDILLAYPPKANKSARTASSIVRESIALDSPGADARPLLTAGQECADRGSR